MNQNNASPWARLLAYFVDLLMMFLVPILFLNVVSTSDNITMFLDRALFYLVFVVFIYPVFYVALNSFLIKTFGGTFGKLVTGTRIVNSNGLNISFLRALFRNHIGYMISGVMLWLGFVWILVDKERRSWHDQIADTYVVTRNKTMMYLGVVVLIALVLFEVGVISRLFNNFSANKEIYTEAIQMLDSSLDETPIDSYES